MYVRSYSFSPVTYRYHPLTVEFKIRLCKGRCKGQVKRRFIQLIMSIPPAHNWHRKPRQALFGNETLPLRYSRAKEDDKSQVSLIEASIAYSRPGANSNDHERRLSSLKPPDILQDLSQPCVVAIQISSLVFFFSLIRSGGVRDLSVDVHINLHAGGRVGCGV